MNNFITPAIGRFFLSIIFLCLFLFAAMSTAEARRGLILQVSENNPKTWNLLIQTVSLKELPQYLNNFRSKYLLAL